MPSNWEAREKKIFKRSHGMRVSNRSIFVMDESNRKRDEKIIAKANAKARKGKYNA